MSVFGGDYETRDGTCIKDYIHVEDLAEAHYLGMKYLVDGGKSNSFNLGNNEGFTVLEMIKVAEKVTGEKILFDIAGRRTGDSPRLIASNQKAKDLLGWNPKRSDIETILRDAYNWEINRKF